MKNLFHAHLDKCAQCRNNPFGLCEEGRKLLVRAAKPLRMPNDRR